MGGSLAEQEFSQIPSFHSVHKNEKEIKKGGEQLKYTLSQDSIHGTKNFFKRERWKEVLLFAGIWAGICSTTVWLRAGHEKLFDCQRTVAPLSEQISWLMWLSRKGGIGADVRGTITQRESNLNINQRGQGQRSGGERKRRGSMKKDEKNEVSGVLWKSTCCL